MADTKARRKRRRYTAEQRQSALADVEKLGVRGAARKHGMPASTLDNWVRQGAAESGQKPAERAQSAKGAETSAESERRPRTSTSSASRPTPAKEEETGEPGQRPSERARLAEKRPQSPGEAAETKPARGRQKARRYTPSEKAEALETAAKEGVSAASAKHGMSRFSIYQWQRQLSRASQGQGPSPLSGPDPAELEAQRDREILAEWKRHPGLGPSQIRNQLRRQGIKVSVNTVREVMIANGYRPPKVKREPHDERFEAVRPNHLWHLDFIVRYVNKTKTFTLILLDDYSRYVVGHGVGDAERADLVLETFEQATARHGRPERVINDKGSAFWSWRGISRFTALLTEMGIDQVVAEHKEWNGKIEAFNGNLHTELFAVHRFYDVAEMRRRLAAHLWWYNHQRTHHSLGGLLVPADRFYGRVEEVMARIEAGAGRDGLDALSMHDRRLDLFKVISQGGVAEVWLMGQKMFELRP